MVDWPATLPFSIKYGASTELGKGIKISTEMEYGNKKRRKRFTRTAAMQQVTLGLTDGQLETFQNFYAYLLDYGTISFNAPVIVGSSIEVRRCTIDDDSVTIVHTDYNRHEVSFNLEIYNLLGSPADDGINWLIGMYGNDYALNVLFPTIEYQVNTHYPQIMEQY